MRKNTFIYFFPIVVAFSTLFSCNSGNQKTAGKNSNSQDSLVKRGEYLVTIIGCNDCHSPKNMGANGPEIDMNKQLSGFESGGSVPPFDTTVIKKGLVLFSGDLTAAAGPWGISFSSNITPDTATGIGKWTEEQFSRAIRQGKYNGDVNGRTILPPMPWQDFSALKDEDVKAIFAFLKSVKPVVNKVPAPIAFNQMK